MYHLPAPTPRAMTTATRIIPANPVIRPTATSHKEKHQIYEKEIETGQSTNSDVQCTHIVAYTTGISHNSHTISHA